MDVALLPWPGEEGRRAELARQHTPRLLLVEPEAAAPTSVDVLEDWVRLPVPEGDLDARVRGLRLRAHTAGTDRPVVSGTGTLEYRGRRLELSPHQARLIENLASHFGTVVGRDALARAGWQAGVARTNTLDVHIARLRRRIQPLGLRIEAVRSRGYLLTGA